MLGVSRAALLSASIFSTVEYHLWGGGGGGPSWSNPVDVIEAGSGAYIKGTLYLLEGTTLHWVCGSAGGRPSAGSFGSPGAGLTTGAGTTGAGGGFSGLFKSSVARANALAVAGGGSGGGWTLGGRGGNVGNQKSGNMTGDDAYTPGDNRATGGCGGGYDGGEVLGLTEPGGGSNYESPFALSTASEDGNNGTSNRDTSQGAASVGTSDPYYATNAGKGGGYDAIGQPGRVVIYVNGVEQVATSTAGTGSFTI